MEVGRDYGSRSSPRCSSCRSRHPPHGTCGQTIDAQCGARSHIDGAILRSSARVVASQTSPVVNGIEIQVVPPGSFGSYDPADECGNFGAQYQGGGNNCYLVIRFINPGASAVTFTSVDLHMVDQTGDEYMLEPVAPACYDTLDVNAPQTLQPGDSVHVQRCFPVMAGALPQTMKGTRSLAGLTLTVPTDSIDGTWGGL
jgi:hypothetical protein